ncbi:MAG: hypothetical protein KDA28_01600, partial [Phycisphaerales bacterium]|nr:hypothetical protein [Phycisphaerales bacterium]
MTFDHDEDRPSLPFADGERMPYDLHLPEGYESPSARSEGARLGRRILIALAMMILLAFVCLWLLPRVGIVVPPIALMLVFVAIVIGSVMSLQGESPRTPPRPVEDDGRPVGCCPGPRPP